VLVLSSKWYYKMLNLIPCIKILTMLHEVWRVAWKDQRNISKTNYLTCFVWKCCHSVGKTLCNMPKKINQSIFAKNFDRIANFDLWFIVNSRFQFKFMVMPNELVLTTQITDLVELNQEVRPNWDDYYTMNSINFGFWMKNHWWIWWI
jgi:hypothetical protein